MAVDLPLPPASLFKSSSIGTMTEESLQQPTPNPKISTSSAETSTSSTDLNAETEIRQEIDPPANLVFDLENFFNYWLTSSSNAASKKTENDENNKFLKKSIVKVLMDSMAELKSEHSFRRVEPKSSCRSRGSWTPNAIEHNTNEDRVGLYDFFFLYY